MESGDATSIASKKILDVGCGWNKTPGAVGMDSNPKTHADVIHDLGNIPYPFADDEFDEIVCRHVAEHVPDLFPFYTEVKLRPIRTYVSLANLWRSLGLEFIVNLDQRWPAFRFTRKFWEFYLCNVIRGKELRFDLVVVKAKRFDESLMGSANLDKIQ